VQILARLNNQFDNNAVAVLSSKGEQLDYVPKGNRLAQGHSQL
jgi:hypothetical protein